MWEKLQANLDFWTVVGLVAQAAFTARFLVQWIVSERRGRSVIPIAFWYLSLLGSGGLLLYALVRADPVFILGQSFGSIVYLRNLMLIYRERRVLAESARAGAVTAYDEAGRTGTGRSRPIDETVPGGRADKTELTEQSDRVLPSD